MQRVHRVSSARDVDRTATVKTAPSVTRTMDVVAALPAGPDQTVPTVSDLSFSVQHFCVLIEYVPAVLFCSSAVLDPRVGHTMNVISPFISVLCHSD